MRAIVHRVPMSDPSDVSGVVGLIESGTVAADDILAILGKTEGNGCVNDFTRGYATASLKTALAEQRGCRPKDLDGKVAFVMSGGTEGGLSPHFLVFARAADGAPAAGQKRLALGTAFTRAFAPEEIGRRAQVEETAAAVRAAMTEAGITEAGDVHYVQIKCPLLTRERMAEAEARGQRVATEDTYHSMGLSRGASALGVALALGEVAAVPPDAAIGHDLTLFSSRASTSAGIELMRNEIMVAGMSAAWGGDLVIDHAVMKDGIDLPAAQGVLGRLGLPVGGQLDEMTRTRFVALLAKAEPSRSGTIRGARHIMWDDSDINATRHARALVGGVLAGLIGDTRLFVSGGAEHQGPDGGGPVAIIARAH